MSPNHQDGQDEQLQRGQDQPADTGARPDEILRDGVHRDAVSDEEAVLAYNANAEDGDPEPDSAGEEDGED